MDRRAMYKKKTKISIDLKRRNIRSERQCRRTNIYNERRNIMEHDLQLPEESSEPTGGVDKLENRKLALQKYIAEREALKKVQKLKQRPPFKVGIPHHGSSPVLRELTNFEVDNHHKPITVIKNVNEQKNLRVTRSTARAVPGNVFKERPDLIKPKPMPIPVKSKKNKVLSPVKAFPFKENKSMFNFHSQRVASIKKLTSPHTPTVLKRSARKVPFLFPPRHIQETKVKDKEFVTAIEEPELLATPLPDADADSNTSQTGPAVESTSSEDGREEETASTSSPSSPPEPADGPTFQRARLEKETACLLALAEEWEKLALAKDLPKEVADEVDSVVGNTRLLTRDKFSQFRGLIEEYERNDATRPITCEDLNGFWDMMYLQVERLQQSYKDLQNLKDNDWVQMQPEIKKKRRVGAKSKQTSNPKPTTKVSSSIRNFVLAKWTRDTASTMNEDLATVSQDSPANPQARSNQSLSLRNSPSPYIAMRLSGVFRSVRKSPNLVDTNLTPKSILKREEEVKPQTSEKKLLNILKIEVEAKPQTCEKRPSILKREVNANSRTPDKKTVLFYDEGQENLRIPEHVFTPRRSIRLMGRTPTPYCKACPNATDKVTPRRSTRILNKTPQSND